MTGTRRVRSSGLLLFAAVAAAGAAAASAQYATSQKIDEASGNPQLHEEAAVVPPENAPPSLGAPRVWEENPGKGEGMQDAQEIAEFEGAAEEGEKETEVKDRMDGRLMTPAQRRVGPAYSNNQLAGLPNAGWEGNTPQPAKPARQWAEGNGEAGREWTRALRSAGSSIRRISRRVYQRSEDYWKEPRRRRALIYFATVTVMAVALAFAEHRTRLRAAEGQQLREREAFMMDIERDIAMEAEAVKKGLAEADAIKEEQERATELLAKEQAAVEKHRAHLRRRMAALQEEQLALSVRKAKSQLASLQELEEEEDKQLVQEKLLEIREQANTLFWHDEEGRKKAAAALTKMSVLEVEVRSHYNTLLRMMDMSSWTPEVRQQAMWLKEQLRDSVADLEIQVHEAILAFTDDLWVAMAERKLLLDPGSKEQIRRGIERQWPVQAKHQRIVAEMQDEGREALEAKRREIATVKNLLDYHMTNQQREQMSALLFGLMSTELYQESFLRVLDADVARHLDRRAWLSKMQRLLGEAEERAQAAMESWGTERAALAELKGKVKGIRTILASLDDTLDLCFTVHETWYKKWGTGEPSG